MSQTAKRIEARARPAHGADQFIKLAQEPGPVFGRHRVRAAQAALPQLLAQVIFSATFFHSADTIVPLCDLGLRLVEGVSEEVGTLPELVGRVGEPVTAGDQGVGEDARTESGSLSP